MNMGLGNNSFKAKPGNMGEKPKKLQSENTLRLSFSAAALVMLVFLFMLFNQFKPQISFNPSTPVDAAEIVVFVPAAISFIAFLTAPIFSKRPLRRIGSLNAIEFGGAFFSLMFLFASGVVVIIFSGDALGSTINGYFLTLIFFMLFALSAVLAGKWVANRP